MKLKLSLRDKRATSVLAILTLALSSSLLTACQSSNSSAPENALASAASDEQAMADTNDLVVEASTSDENSAAAPQTTAISATTGGQCSIRLAGGPPPVPPRGADFGKAVAKNTGKAVQRGVLQQIGGAVAGGLGAAIAGGVGQATIRQEEDIKGVWMITDGSNNCACEVSVDSIYKLKGKGADTGNSKTRACTDTVIQQVAAWQLGYAFAGYGAKFELKKADKKTVLATMTRQGIHYFSGTLADGRPVTMWRNGQTYNQLTAFNKSLR